MGTNLVDWAYRTRLTYLWIPAPMIALPFPAGFMMSTIYSQFNRPRRSPNLVGALSSSAAASSSWLVKG